MAERQGSPGWRAFDPPKVSWDFMRPGGHWFGASAKSVVEMAEAGGAARAGVGLALPGRGFGIEPVEAQPRATHADLCEDGPTGQGRPV
jgi:hypothetical protein